MVNNTYVNQRAASGSFLRVAGTPAVVKVVNNLITGSKTVLTGPGECANNLMTDAPGFADAAQGDYRLEKTSPAAGKGVEPGKAGDFPLAPEYHYRHPAGGDPRPKGEALPVGACPVVGRK